MTKKKVTIMWEKKFKKEFNRKKAVKEKKKLSNEQVNTAMQNIDLLESRRREAVNKYLESNSFTRPVTEDPEDKGKAIYLLKKTKYILEKVNLAWEVMEALENDAAKFTGLYQITDIKTRKKWQIFQVNFIEKTAEFKIVKLLDRENIDYKKIK